MDGPVDRPTDKASYRVAFRNYKISQNQAKSAIHCFAKIHEEKGQIHDPKSQTVFSMGILAVSCQLSSSDSLPQKFLEEPSFNFLLASPPLTLPITVPPPPPPPSGFYSTKLSPRDKSPSPRRDRGGGGGGGGATTTITTITAASPSSTFHLRSRSR